jgi:L-threonylcarbamoyladenylate synthase
MRACLSDAGVVVFPADTVYGLGCDPDSELAVRRLYGLKGYPPARRPTRPAAVMFFALDHALRALVDLQPREHGALRALLPGPLTLLLPNRAHRYPLACGPDPDTLGLRVPLLPDRLAALSALDRPLLQSSANPSGGSDCRRLHDVPESIRAGAELVLDGGELPGLASTVLDLRDYARSGSWRILREGPLEGGELKRILGSC